MRLLRSLLTYTGLALYVILAGPLGILAAWIAGRPGWLYSIGKGGLRLALWLAGVRFTATGLDKVQPGRNYVFISNHVSNLDPIILILAIPRNLRVIVKKELRKIPLVGKAMAMVGFVFVDRRRREDALGGVDRSASMIRSGNSFLVFPEGTRSDDGRLSAFKKGAFVMAIKGGADLLPMVIDGSYELLPRGAFAAKAGKVVVRFLDPIPTAGLSYADRGGLLDEAKAAMLQALSLRHP